ncbi:MAG: DUF3037 domain-containing protein [Chitinophagaceae bacterium]|nr:DUF3037 domain-containing protein [Chitinophagaceae bacterium]
MSGRQLYEYAVIQVVPRVERGEFVNAGVILFSKEAKYIGMRYEVNEEKIRALDSATDINKITNLLNTFEKICYGMADSGPIGRLDAPERFRWLTAKRSTMIQTSEVHPGLCANPEKKLEQLFRELVL